MTLSIREADQGLPIAAVEQATGIARATLRIWERRYGFPRPQRDVRDERSYEPEQVEKLRLIAGLLARGHRPGRLVTLSAAQLAVLAVPAAADNAEPMSRAAAGAGDPVLALLQRHDMAGLAVHLEEEISSRGLDGFVTRRMPVLNQMVGAAWASGELQVYEEHLYTEATQLLLHNAIARLPAVTAQARPRVLLATFPEESHGLGLLMAQVLLVIHGCRCTALGVRVPLAQMVSAAAALDADVVGLSFSASINPAHVLRGLAQLRGDLPPRISIWAGGSCPVLARRQIAGVRAVRDIADAPAAVAEWRSRQ